MEAVEKAVKEIKGDLDLMLKAAEDRMITGLGIEDLKGQVKNALEQLETVKKESKDYQDQVDAALKGMKRPGAGGKPEGGFKEALEEKFQDLKKGARSGSLLSLKGTQLSTIELAEKAVGDFNAANVSTGSVVFPFAGVQQLPGVQVQPLYDRNIRPYLRQVTTSSPSIVYVEETAKEGGFAPTAMGALKPQIDFDLSMKQANVIKIAGHMRLPEEMIDDIPYLLDYVTTRGVEEYRNAEDDQLLFGDGTSLNLTGLFTAASAFNPGATFKVQDSNYFDVLVAAKTQIRKLNMLATVIWVSPEDWARMRLTKTTTGEYVFPVIPGTNVITIDGTPIIDNTRIPVGQFLVADGRYSQIADRKGLEVRLFDQDRDNAIRNMVTIVIEARLALLHMRPQGLVKGTFSTAVDAITPA